MQTVGTMQNCLTLNMMVQKVAARLEKIKKPANRFYSKPDKSISHPPALFLK